MQIVSKTFCPCGRISARNGNEIQESFRDVFQRIYFMVLQAAKYTPEVFTEYMELMLECLPMRVHWKPVADFLKLDGVTLLLQLIAMAAEWHNYTGK